MGDRIALIGSVGLVILAGVTRPSIVGRWDLTVRGPGESWPSWVEVTRSGSGLAGRFQGRSGHATALSAVRQEANRFFLTWPDDEKPGARPTEIEGSLTGPGAITGTVITPSGDRLELVGRRAPPLVPRGKPIWGQPIDLLAEGLAGWTARESANSNWAVEQGELVNRDKSSDLISRRRFGDFKLRLEVNVPPGGNSGIYLRGRYEVQVLDSWGKPAHSRQMGGIYGQVTPTSLPARRPGEWQSFEITLVGRRVTVGFNGVTIIDRVDIPGITGGALDSDEAAPGPLMLQGDHTAIRYRNIVLTPRQDAP